MRGWMRFWLKQQSLSMLVRFLIWIILTQRKQFSAALREAINIKLGSQQLRRQALK
jgi:hypothetical protein